MTRGFINKHGDAENHGVAGVHAFSLSNRKSWFLPMSRWRSRHFAFAISHIIFTYVMRTRSRNVTRHNILILLIYHTKFFFSFVSPLSVTSLDSRKFISIRIIKFVESLKRSSNHRPTHRIKTAAKRGRRTR